MTKYLDILNEQRRQLQKALGHLAYSYAKIQKFSLDTEELDDETLETWESFAARFARVSDIFLARYLRTYILNSDPGFRGSFRDFVNQAEKLGLIDDTTIWFEIRELRNISAHEYNEDNLTQFYQQLKVHCPRLLKLTDLLAESCA
jgi:hypothetical protein